MVNIQKTKHKIINRLDILSRDAIRDALEKGTIPQLGVELDSRRKVDFDIGFSSISGNEEIRVYYEDPLRNIKRFELGRIELDFIWRLIKALKEAFIEYNHYMHKSLLLKEFV